MRLVGQIVMGAVVLGLVVLVFVLSAAQGSPSAVSVKFMEALATGNVDKLTELSYVEVPKEELRKKWEYALKVAGPTYRFIWTVEPAVQASDTTAAAKLNLTHKTYSAIPMDDKYEIPMVKHDGKWLVDVAGLNREIFPALPR